MKPTDYDPKHPPKLREVKICCISDTHTETNNLSIPQCDIVIHAGDITYRGELDKLSRFDEWGGRLPLPTDRKIVIAGNHDITLERESEIAEAHLTQWTYLRDSSVTVLGLKVYGTPWSPSFYPENWVFNQDRGEPALQRWEQIPTDTDILVVHGPPYGYGDAVRGVNVGCVDLTNRLNLIRPRLTVCGHIHEGYGIFAAPWGTVVNASVMTGGYKPKNKPIVVTVAVPMES